MTYQPTQLLAKLNSPQEILDELRNDHSLDETPEELAWRALEIQRCKERCSQNSFYAKHLHDKDDNFWMKHIPLYPGNRQPHQL